MGAYFAIAAELDELDTLQNMELAEMALLLSLILAYKYIPVKTALTSYLHDYYNQKYPVKTEIIMDISTSILKERF
jgi:hypothetical protein